jgi:hypothetical protein
MDVCHHGPVVMHDAGVGYWYAQKDREVCSIMPDGFLPQEISSSKLFCRKPFSLALWKRL